MDKGTIKRKIEKLLALGKSANESETLSAVQAARKLILKYYISMSEGDETDIRNRQVASRVSIKELRFKSTPVNQHHLMLATPTEVMEAYEKLNIKKAPGLKSRSWAFPVWSAFAHGENSGKQAVDGRSLSSERKKPTCHTDIVLYEN